jgi:hypothetical protein
VERGVRSYLHPQKNNDFYFYVTFALVVERVITHLSPPMTFKDEKWVDGNLPIPTEIT